MSIAYNLAVVRERIAKAAHRAGREPYEIALMAVSKTFPAESLREAFDAGQRLFGENRVQEFAEKSETLPDWNTAEFHMIGHLQSNKAATAVELFHSIDSVDSLRLLQRLNSAAEEQRKKLRVLIEVNVGGESAKTGVAPDFDPNLAAGTDGAKPSELTQMLLAAPDLTSLDFEGLMTVPPFTEDADGARPYFRQLRELRDRICALELPGVRMNTLSMGMSHDFEVAIEEGSTCVRLGTAVFGSRGRR